MLLNSYIDWEADTLPLLTSPEVRVYDAPDMSESCYLDFKENFPFQQSCIDNYTVLNPRYFSPCFPEDVQENGCEVLYGYGVFTFWVTVMAYYMCAKALSRANNATENDNDDAPATPRRSTGVASALARAAASSAHTKKRGQVEDDGGEGAMDKYGNAWTMDNTNEVHGMHVKEDSRPMVFIFWAKPKDKAFLLTLAKAVNVIIRLHRGSDDMQKNKSPYAKNIYTYITLDRAPMKGYFENNTLTMFFCVSKERPALFTKYNTEKRCTITIKVDNNGFDYRSRESAQGLLRMDDRIGTNDLSCENGELRVTNYVCPKAIVNLMRLKCNMLINDGALKLHFIMANYCNGRSLYKNIRKIATTSALWRTRTAERV
ncbi:hypothetical protein HPB51_018227 [Rhipicephalus microplus]|uniref:Uncharacterized protein n=1 Tax=Rhipicephalus microplus TaxID=6941 RepID=A0A9J6E3K4_RHIMP|nr:hypothetical protein HPB51_018227 [Rhipicephalus microplus]